jgi:predicted lipid carrier protein YhbT
MALTSDQLYEIFGELFVAFKQDPKMVAKARKTNIVAQYAFLDPNVKITINAKVDPPDVVFRDCDLKPDLTISGPTKVLHKFLMGKANAADLYLKRQITIRPMAQAMKYIKLIPMFLALLKRYEEVIKEKGLEQEAQEWLVED